jgi:hypothetical protein
MPEPNIINEARNNFGSMSFGYLITTPIKIEKMPRNWRDLAM